MELSPVLQEFANKLLADMVSAREREVDYIIEQNKRRDRERLEWAIKHIQSLNRRKTE